MKTLLESLREREQGIPVLMDVKKDFYPVEASTDSWFFVGNAKTETRDYSFLLHLMVLTGDDKQKMMKMCYSVSEHVSGFYSATDTTVPVNGTEQAVAVDGEVLTVKAGDFRFSGTLEEMRVVGNNGNSSVDVTVRPLGKPIMNCGTGYYPIKTVKDNYHYSLPFSEMTGSISIEGKAETVCGNCWLDRQYNRFDMKKGAGGFESPGAWVWLGISVNDGTAISLWDFDDENGVNRTFATCLLPNGNRCVIDMPSIMPDAQDIFISDKTNRYYPTKWFVNIPEFDIALEIPCFPKNQEIVAAMPAMHKFEGASGVKGTIKGRPVEGHCMIELSGPWTKEFVESKGLLK